MWEQAYHVVKVHEGVVDGSDDDVVVLERGAEHETTDAAEAVDADASNVAGGGHSDGVG